MMETWIVQEYADQGTLLGALGRGIFSADNPERMARVLSTCTEVAGALVHLHNRG